MGHVRDMVDEFTLTKKQRALLIDMQELQKAKGITQRYARVLQTMQSTG